MALLREYIPGARKDTFIITDKWTSYSSRSMIYNISWEDKTRNYDFNHDNIGAQYWDNLQKGDSIVVYRIGNSEEPYLYNGIYQNDSNMIMTLMMVLAALAVIAYQIYMIRKSGDVDTPLDMTAV